jgi:tRNA-dihydrouridine synthase
MNKPFFVLAPMDDVTDSVFRQVVHGNAPADLYFTEFVNVDGLMSPGRSKLLKKLRFAANEGPLVAQLWGLKPENFEAIARQIADGTIAREICILNDQTGSLHGDAAQGVREEQTEPYLSTVKGVPQQDNTAMRSKPDQVISLAGQQGQAVHTCPNYVGVDLNMGCPAKSEVQNGACSALIKNRPLAEEIINATKKGAGDMPVSVKTRLGFSEIDLSWIEFLLGFDLHMLTVHWRTRKEMSKVPAHWEYAGEVVKIRDKIAKNTLIVGNGDILDRKSGLEMVEKYGLDGIMIGRGVFNDPFVFAQESPWESIPREQRIAMYRQHVELFAKTWTQGERPIHTLNKFCKVYISDFDGAKELREPLMAANSTSELLDLLS